MRKVLLTAALAAAALLAPGLVPQARADHEWLAIGHAFSVGHAHISFFFGRPGFGHGYHQPAYYYRYDRPIRYRGHQCSRYCFREARHYYHHDSCPLVRAHFNAHRVDPRWAFERYAPRYRAAYPEPRYYEDRYSGRGHRRDADRYRDDRYRDDRRDRRDRYDRRDDWRCRDRYCDDRRDHRRDDRGDKGDRGRGRGHRHHRGCGHG